MDLPFLLPQTRIFRAYGLTPDLKMRYGADINIVSVKLPKCMYSQYIGIAMCQVSQWLNFTNLLRDCLFHLGNNIVNFFSQNVAFF
jgi:hypothetical protein